MTHLLVLQRTGIRNPATRGIGFASNQEVVPQLRLRLRRPAQLTASSSSRPGWWVPLKGAGNRSIIYIYTFIMYKGARNIKVLGIYMYTYMCIFIYTYIYIYRLG